MVVRMRVRRIMQRLIVWRLLSKRHLFLFTLDLEHLWKTLVTASSGALC
jgi:hypothetical protein